ncbi:scavenger receptor cysteine-rich type 1 protein M130-like [Sander lucioperca]|uniref:scavenger receptor cysteine-rich type 1 protein M130-like n=1 Tax=Sander lucioperca TaxID=283035 RepID=UPI001653BE5B|nr:scavenger receptor cysteine-rich type 1 protein M130-like [Sander lucioperca]
MLHLDMYHLLVLLLLCSPGLQAEGEHTSTEPVRLVGGASRCAGTLELEQGEWRPVSYITVDYYSDWNLKTAAAACRELDCGSAVSVEERQESSVRSVWRIRSDCVESGSTLRKCASSDSSSSILYLSCSDSVRLVNGTSLCSGRLEVKTNQSNQRWSSVCEDDFDQQDAEVVCRELGCGPPSVLQGALYGEVEPPMRTKEFQCGGQESALLDYRSSGSDRNTCSPGKAVGLTCSEPDAVRLVGGASRCAGTLELQYHRYWRPVGGYYYPGWNLKKADAVCRELNCGSAVSVEERQESSVRSVWRIRSECVRYGYALRKCATSDSSSSILDLTCSDSVRLMNGTSLCSGRLEVKTNQSTQRWSSVCEDDFDQQDAEVVCRELGCGPPSVLQGVLYGEVEPPMRSKEFQCGGHESALLDCRSSVSDRNTCSPGKAVGLTCSEPVRLVGGSSHCAGILEVKQGEWRPMVVYPWTLMTAAAACRELDCGSAVSVEERKESSHRSVWRMRSNCVQSGSALRDCAESRYSAYIQDLTCSDSVRLVNGTSLCSGRLEVKTNQSTQRWSSVCEDDFDQQDAEVVCRELGCGPPSILQGVLYGEVEPPMRSKEFQCGGHESALMDCRSSGSDRNTCSPGKVVGLTCSEPVRLVGGSSHCAGTLEVKQGEWRPMVVYPWTLKTAAAVCRELDCGSAVSVEERKESSHRSVWRMRSNCVQSGSALRDCAESRYSAYIQDLTCSDSVRLVNGTSLCSGRLEVKTNQSTQHWSSVCEDDFDQQDAEVVCRELGCGAPSVLQGALYGEVEPPMWTKEFQCGGNESALLDCRSSVSDRNTCSPGKAVGVTCSEPVRLVGGAIHCAGTLEVKQGEWRPMVVYPWTLKTAAAVCRELDCGSAVSVEERKESSDRSVWRMRSNCVQSGSALRECAESHYSAYIQDFTCSDLLLQPNISVSSSMDGVSEAQQQGFQVFRDSTFTISCSIQPQYPGGSFQLTFTSSNSTHNSTQPAVNHSAHFLFPAAEPAHQGTYSCVYHVYVFSQNFSSESRLLSLTVSDLLLQPNISVSSSMDGVSVAQQQVFQVFRDSNFTISCSIQPQYPGGSFQLTFTSSNSTHNSTQPAINHSAHFLFPAAEPAHQGTYSCVYHVYVFSQNFSSESRLLSLTVSDLLLQPNISVSSSMDGVSEAQQQVFQVFRDSNFTISCSIQPQYPGGSFQLTFTSSNSTHNSTQPAINHSAHFLFPAAEPAHQGTYSCVYHVYVFSQNFSSESRLLSLTVSDASDPPGPPTRRPFIIGVVMFSLTLLLVITALPFYCKASRGQKPDRQKNIELLHYKQLVATAEGGLTDEDGAQGAE